MKIIAVIPARANSKGIPNKNIRLLNGKPMICYAIDNAKKSNYITDIIISSDSPEIQVIAKQMGVSYKKREDSLCGDATTLDSVIYNAVAETDGDIVITLQPTSPTLSVETLDKAIGYFVANNLDTLIAAVNAPKLSWSKRDGRIMPNYKKRLNRQYLPEEYVEAGAFLISRKDIISEESRIGDKVEIFEIPKEEAIDIDDFSDLMYAESILQRKKVAIYVNGNNKMGMGHIYRSLDIADEFYSKPDIYFDINQTTPDLFGHTMHRLIQVNGIEELVKKVEESKYDIMINDVLATSLGYMKALREASPDMKIINFEDDGEGVYEADLVVNALYHEEKFAQMKAGENYYIPPKLFLFYQPINIKDRVEKVFISFGGADPQNYTKRLLQIITKDAYKGYKFTIAIGRAYENIDDIMKYNHLDNIEVFYDVKNMPELMSACDVAVTSRGRTGYELALLGIPTIAMAQNRKEEKHAFISADHGFNYLGLNPSDSLIESNLSLYLSMSKSDREQIQSKLLENDLKNGRKRVMSMINGL